jgi:hypothetical protein
VSYVPALVRGSYGVLLVSVPGSLIRLAGGSAGNPRARAVARLLGVRHLTQAALAAVGPSPALLALGAEVDLLHSASMMALGGADAPSRRIAFIDGVVAAAFAADGIAAARRAVAAGQAAAGRAVAGETAHPGASGGFTQRRNAAAGRLAVLAIPRALRPWLTGPAGR